MWINNLTEIFGVYSLLTIIFIIFISFIVAENFRQKREKLKIQKTKEDNANRLRAQAKFARAQIEFYNWLKMNHYREFYEYDPSFGELKSRYLSAFIDWVAENPDVLKTVKGDLLGDLSDIENKDTELFQKYLQAIFE